MKLILKQKNKGFTLIELMVATSIFVIIMLSAIGSLTTLLAAAKSARALRFTIDNVNFAMESMTRSIRMGTNYICSPGPGITMYNNPDQHSDCREGGTFIAFLPQNTDSNYTRLGYKLHKKENSNNYTIQRCYGNSCVDMVSSNVQIETLKFFVNNSDPDDGKQASVYIIVKGTIVLGNTSQSFAIQTLASQRNF